MKRTSGNPRWLLPVVAGLFLLSGASGLIYQVLWLRLLGLVFGVTVYAASTVWASFMGGLALGSLIGGRFADGVRRPLVWFGAVEALVGISALATPAALGGLQQLYGSFAPGAATSLATMTVVRLAMSFAVLVIPTMLMGASLPLVIKSSLFRSEQLGTRVSLLYGTNTAGAIAGTLAAGLSLIPTIGIQRTFWVAASANLFVGLVAIAIGLWLRPSVQGDADIVAPRDADTAPMLANRIRYLILAVFFVSGAATLALEVIWFRVIVLIVRPTVYAFSLMLAGVLLGIALGSYLAAPWMRRRTDRLLVLAAVELLLGFTALVSLVTLNYAQTLTTWLEPALSKVLPSYVAYTIAVALPAVVPASILMGMAFPIGLQLWARGSGDDASRTASRIGIFYSCNVAGAILGSLAGGFFLLPLLGSRGSLIAVASVIFVSGLALILAAGYGRQAAGQAAGDRRQAAGRMARYVTAAALAAGFALVALRVGDPFDAFLRVRFPDHHVIWREESVQATVSVHRQPDGQLNLHLEGNHQASDHPGMVSTHARLGHLPMIVHPDPRSALVVGLGAGATAGGAAMHEAVRIDVVELSGAVVRGARYFRHINRDLFAHPNVHLRVDDGRNFLLWTRNRYDVITADIILPIYAGSNNVYSADYFQLVRRALKPGGMYVQWVAGTEAEYKTIMRTFLRVFPDATLWSGGSLMLGTLEPLRLRRVDFDWKLDVPGRRRALEAFGTRSFEDLLAMYRAGPEEMRAFVGRGPILTDDLPMVEYFLALPRDRDPDLSTLRGDVMRHVK